MLLFLSCFNNNALAVENMLWQGNPLYIPILVNTERRIDFPEPIVDINMSAYQKSNSTVLLTPEGRLFFKPTTVYAPARLKVISITGTLYLVDIESKPEGSETSSKTIVIIDPVIHAAGGGMSGAGTGNRPNANAMPLSNTPNQAAIGTDGARIVATNPDLDYLPDFLRKDMSINNGSNNGSSGNNSSNAAPDYIAMSRYALAHFAGPARLIPKIGNASQVKVKQPSKNWIRIAGGSLEIKALAQWSINGHFVTAIYVRNKTSRAIEFDPRGIRGDIKFVGAMHTYLEPRGTNGDEGLWAIVTAEPFNLAINAK